MEQRIRLAWQDAWEEQAKDIDELEAADLSSRRLDLQQLLTDSENVTLSDERAGTTGEQALRADLTRARAVTRDLMRFWRFSTTQTDEFLSVPGRLTIGGTDENGFDQRFATPLHVTGIIPRQPIQQTGMRRLFTAYTKIVDSRHNPFSE